MIWKSGDRFSEKIMLQKSLSNAQTAQNKADHEFVMMQCNIIVATHH
jgi:hypothetical protein